MYIIILVFHEFVNIEYDDIKIGSLYYTVLCKNIGNIFKILLIEASNWGTHCCIKYLDTNLFRY